MNEVSFSDELGVEELELGALVEGHAKDMCELDEEVLEEDELDELVSKVWP